VYSSELEGESAPQCALVGWEARGLHTVADSLARLLGHADIRGWG
jgi:hypothetical protein